MQKVPQAAKPEDSGKPFGECIALCDLALKQIKHYAGALAKLATMYDVIAEKTAAANPVMARQLNEVAEHADFCLALASRELDGDLRCRARTSRSVDLMCDAISSAMGDGRECLELIERFYRLSGVEAAGESDVEAETFPDQFLWDLTQRVESFPALAERYPHHLHTAARHLQGLPMLVTHHLDVTHGYDKLAEILRVGIWHPLDVSPRRKRGGPTPALRYLEPLVWRMNSMRHILRDVGKGEGTPVPLDRVDALWRNHMAESTPAEELAVVAKLSDLPRLTKHTSLVWSREVIVPYILLTDGADPATSTEPFLRNIWAHRSVKSVATFRSRLERAVTDFLTRYGREE